METDQKLAILATIGKVHGIKGWLRVHSYTVPQTNLGDYRLFSVSIGSVRKEIEMDQFRLQGKNLIAHFEGYDLPELAQELVGVDLQIPSSKLPKLQPGEYYWQQLQGLRVVNLEGQLLGIVSRLMETGANDVIVVSPGGGSIDSTERLIPYLLESVIKKIDLEGQVIEVDWAADFLV